MIALLQRVKQAAVHVGGKEISHIEQGLLVFIGIEKGDTNKQADRLIERLLGYRVFSDQNDKMNLSLQDIQGELLLVPQFTLAADTRKGMRPSFTPAASPENGERLFNYLVERSALKHPAVRKGQFAANMQISLINDGPVTFWLQTPPN